MTFASFQFVLLFLPLAFAGFVLADKFGGRRWVINYLAAISLLFFSFWGVQLLLILVASVLFNFWSGQRIAALSGEPAAARRRMLLSIAANLLLLGYLKYTNFFIDIANQLSGASNPHVVLPLSIGVSFFTFIQIGYLVDAYNGQLLPHNLGRYIVFSAFFPCVTAGPLVLQREMMDQLENNSFKAIEGKRILVGLTMFAMGLFKKTVLADSIAASANTMFDGAAAGHAVTILEAWTGSLCYALQLYFDFSGYSDMAIGLGTLFGLKLPLNFSSPFKATNISDFWRRWHMTMTRFFTNYVYSSLALNGMRRSARIRLGTKGRFVMAAALPMIITFVIAGVWHGAGWNYLVYGLLHGIAIAICLAWREFSGIKLPPLAGWLLTMTTVVCGLVLFRAQDVSTAMHILSSMWGIGAAGPAGPLGGFSIEHATALITLLGAIALLMPNTQQILHLDWPIIDTKPPGTEVDAGLVVWRPTLGPAIVSASVFTIALTSIGAGSGFLYYNF